MRCPTCGSPDVYRSKRAWFERIFNWLFWYHQRPYRCSVCMTRHWMRLEPSVWRHTFRSRAFKMLRAWGFYFGALVLAVIIAWSMNYIQQQTQQGNPLIDAAMDQEMMNRLDQSDLSEEQKQKAREFFKEYRK